MTTRRLAPPAALAALLFALGCTASLDAPREKAEAPAEEKPKGDQPHVAPMPRIKKTTAELLVGTWRAVELNGRQVPKGWVYRFTFEQDGQIHTFADDEPNRPRHRSGTYSVDDTKMRFEITNEDGHRASGTGTITEITNSKLVFTSRFENTESSGKPQSYVLQREPTKK